MASDFAESPSVKIKVQFSENLVPASLASSNFSISLILYLFPALIVFPNLLYSLTLACCTIYSTTPLFITFFINFSLNSHFEPS